MQDVEKLREYLKTFSPTDTVGIFYCNLTTEEERRMHDIKELLPPSEEVCKKILSIPMYAELAGKDRSSVVAVIREFFRPSSRMRGSNADSRLRGNDVPS